MYNRDGLIRREQVTRLQIASHERTLMELDKRRKETITLIEELKIRLGEIEYELSKPICNHCNGVIDNGTYSTDGIDGIFCSKRCLLEAVENRIQCKKKTNNEDDTHSVMIDNENDGNCKIGMVGEYDDPWFEKIEKRIQEFGYGFSSNEVYWSIIKEKGTTRKEDEKELDLLTYARIGKILRSLGYARKVMRSKDGVTYSGWYNPANDGVQNDEWYNIIKTGIVNLYDKFQTKDVYCAIIKKYLSHVSENMSRSSAIRICRILRYMGYSTCKYNVGGRSIMLWKKI